MSYIILPVVCVKDSNYIVASHAKQFSTAKFAEIFPIFLKNIYSIAIPYVFKNNKAVFQYSSEILTEFIFASYIGLKI